MALSTRLRTAVTSRAWSPNTWVPASPPAITSMCLACAPSRQRSMASPTTSSTSIGCGACPRVGDLQPGELDDLLHQRGEPQRLPLHALGEPADGLGVVGGVLDRLGEQVQGADRGLELVRDVGDEVPPDLLDPAGLGPVVDQHQHVLGPSGATRAWTTSRPRPSGPRGRSSSSSRTRPCRRTCGGHRAQFGVHQHVAPDQAEGVRGGARLDHVVRRVQHDRGRAEDAQHLGDPRRERRARRAVGLQALPLARARGDDGHGADDQADQSGQQRGPGGVHQIRLGRDRPRVGPDRCLREPPLRWVFT